MEFGPGYWGPVIATGIMLLGIIIGWLILKASHRITPPNPSDAKNATYACGEESLPEETHYNTEEFYSPIRKVFNLFYKYVRPGHSGDLSTYLLWIVLGFIILLASIIVVLW